MDQTYDFSGTWTSIFKYVNKLEPEGGTSEYKVKIHQTGSLLIVESIADEKGNYFVARMKLDPNLGLLTGSWEEDAMPGGIYKGQVYYGVGQLLIDKSSGEMTGKIVEYNNDMEIISGDWTITRLAD